MLLFTILPIIFLTSPVVANWKNVGASLAKRVIHVESLRFRGTWLDSYRRPTMMLHPTSSRDIFNAERSSFVVMDCGKGLVCLETLDKRNYYVTGNPLHSFISIESSTYPQDKDAKRWNISCENENMEKCTITNKMYNESLYASMVYYIVLDGYQDKSGYQFRILAPEPNDEYITILETENHSNVDQRKVISMTEGITDTTSTTTSISSSAQTEVGLAFRSAAKVGVSLSGSWSKTASKTFQQSTSITYNLVIPAKSKITFQQLTGKYGPFKIAAKKFKILSENLTV